MIPRAEGPGLQMATIFDNGPPLPEPPPAPDEQDEDTLERHGRRLAAYRHALREHVTWRAANPEPIKRQISVVDAKEWLTRDPGRYALEPRAA